MDIAGWKRNRMVHGLIGVIIAFVVYLLVPSSEYPLAPFVAAVIALMATWWIMEVIPIAVTSLFPLFLFPLIGVADVAQTGVFYGKPIIFLFLGGFFLAFGLQESGLHKRIALRIVSTIGSRPKQLVLGFMIACGFLSMWISNTASVLVIMPIGLSIMEEARHQSISEKELAKFGVCFMLGIAYAADIGGMATLIGTPPNLIFMEMYQQLFPNERYIGFLEWMMIGLPLSIMFMSGGWFMITHIIFKLPSHDIFDAKDGISRQMQALGPISRDEKLSGLIFGLAALLWMTGSDLRISDHLTIHGWRSIKALQHVTDPAVAVAVSSLLFVIPSKDRQGQALLSWQRARQVPWGILLLFGGGFAIAGGFEMSGLSVITAGIFTTLPPMNTFLIITCVCLFVTFLTELTSNTAITNLMLPILATGAVALAIDPRLLLIPATLSASCAFMMPIASPTQAIIFGSGYVSIRQMMRTGIWFNFLGVILILIVFFVITNFVW